MPIYRKILFQKKIFRKFVRKFRKFVQFAQRIYSKKENNLNIESERNVKVVVLKSYF